MAQDNLSARVDALEQLQRQLMAMYSGLQGSSVNLSQGAAGLAPTFPNRIPNHGLLQFVFTHPQAVWSLLEDFEQLTDGLKGLLTTVAGTNAAITTQDVDTPNRIGVVQGTTGTTNAGTAALGTGVGIARLGNSVWYFRSDIRLTQLDDGTQRFIFRSGLMDSVTAVPANGVYFIYLKTSSDNWILRCKDNNTPTDVVTDVPVVAGEWLCLEGEVDSRKQTANFWINGRHVGAVNGGIPTASGREIGFVPFYIDKEAGTTAVTADIDLALAVAQLVSPAGSRLQIL